MVKYQPEMCYKLVRLAHAAAHSFRLVGFKDLHFVDSLAEEANCYGFYDTETGDLAIRVKTVKGSYFSLSTVLDTLAHELAHLLFIQHDTNHKRLTIAIKIWLQRNWD
jgi:hypothetical protein